MREALTRNILLLDSCTHADFFYYLLLLFYTDLNRSLATGKAHRAPKWNICASGGNRVNGFSYYDYSFFCTDLDRSFAISKTQKPPTWNILYRAMRTRVNLNQFNYYHYNFFFDSDGSSVILKILKALVYLFFITFF